MTSASHILLFALYLCLLFLVLTHETQSCPKSIQFDCPSYTGKKYLEFPFTNSSLPDCGHCVLMCDDENFTRINCVGFENQEVEYPLALDFIPSNLSIVAASRDDLFHEPNKHHCPPSNTGFSSTQSVSFTILGEFESIIRCPYKSPKWDSDPHDCEDGGEYNVYGPYEHDKLPESLPPPPYGCFDIQAPKLPPNKENFTVHYNISVQCKRCLASGGRCHNDDSYGEVHCDTDRTRESRGHPTIIILATVIPVSVVVIIFGGLSFCWTQGKKKSVSSALASRNLSFNRIRTDLEVGSMHGVTVYSYTELEEATNNFDPAKQLGEGGFGVVYHGKLRDGRDVAVKRLYEKSYKRIEQFKNEIRILTDLRHQYLVTLYGCTSRHTRELLLVYEYIPNGTVADHLHGDKTKSRLLPWPKRMSIAIETATALSYLHFKDIIHRDVKTNNILLDNSFSVKVADFGLSRLFPADVTHVSTAPQGTPGYVDPEYHQCYHLTDKSDVYSFGVVLVELISSLLAVDVGRSRHEINLSTYAMNRIQSSALSDLIDPDLGYATNFKVRRMTTLVAELASQCLQHDRELRPSMEEVLEVLKNIESEDYDALEAEEANWNSRTTGAPKPPPSPTDNDGIELLRNARQPPPSPISVINKWLSSTSKSSTSKLSYTSNSS